MIHLLKSAWCPYRRHRTIVKEIRFRFCIDSNIYYTFLVLLGVDLDPYLNKHKGNKVDIFFPLTCQHFDYVSKGKFD